MKFLAVTVFAAGLAAFAQETAAPPPAAAPAQTAPASYTVEPGTKIPLSMINSISTKYAEEGSGPLLGDPIRLI